MNNKLLLFLLFAGGFAVGKNWPKIKKSTGPYAGMAEEMIAKGYNSTLRFLAEQKERVEDTFAASKIKKTKTPDTPRKRARRKVVAAATA